MKQRWLKLGRWVLGAVVIVGAIMLMTYEQHHASEKYQAQCEKDSSAGPGSPEDKKTSADKCQYSDKYLPWWYPLIAWPGGITTWAVLATGGVIGWQSWETRRAAKATEKSVDVTRRQTEMARDKDRARIEIKASTLVLEEDSRWGLRGDAEIRNLGPSRAYETKCKIEIVWCKKDSEWPPTELKIHGNSLSESFIDPAKEDQSLIPVRGYFFDTVETDLNWFAPAAYDGQVRIRMRGTIDYETLSNFYTRIFIFEWKPTSLISGMLSGIYDMVPALTHADRISKGYWKTVMDREIETQERDRIQNSEYENPY